MSSLWLKEKHEKLLKPRGTYQLSPWSLPQRFCSALLEYFFFKLLLMILEYQWGKTTCGLGESDRPADRPSCEGSDVPCLFLQKVHQPQVPGLHLPLPTRRMPKVLLIIQRLSPMTATRHGLQMSYLNDWGVDHRCLLYYESIKPHCAICKASYCAWDEVQEKAVRGYSLKGSITWSKGTLTWDWSFTDLTSVQNRSMCSAENYSQGQLLRLDEAQERAEEKELVMKWCAWWAESQWCIRKDTACV